MFINGKTSVCNLLGIPLFAQYSIAATAQAPPTGFWLLVFPIGNTSDQPKSLGVSNTFNNSSDIIVNAKLSYPGGALPKHEYLDLLYVLYYQQNVQI